MRGFSEGDYIAEDSYYPTTYCHPTIIMDFFDDLSIPSTRATLRADRNLQTTDLSADTMGFELVRTLVPASL